RSRDEVSTGTRPTRHPVLAQAIARAAERHEAGTIALHAPDTASRTLRGGVRRLRLCGSAGRDDDIEDRADALPGRAIHGDASGAACSTQAPGRRDGRPGRFASKVLRGSVAEPALPPARIHTSMSGQALGQAERHYRAA